MKSWCHPGACTFVLLATLLTACRTTNLSQNPKQAFFQKHPELQKRYVQFYETSLEAIDEEIDVRASSIYTLLHSLQNAYDSCADLSERSKEVEKRWETGVAAAHEHVGKMRREFNPATDALFFFRYIEGDNYEYGWLILRHGIIHRKFYQEGPFERRGTVQ